MPIQSILFFGAIILACGCAGLLMVRFDNPRLVGLGWLGAALATGGTGALLLLIDSRQSPLLSILFPDLLVLASLSLLHLAVMELVGLRGIPRLALLLLTLQAASDLFVIYNHASGHFRITVIGLLIAAQATQIAILLLRQATPAVRTPARFINIVLIGFIAWNLLRSLATASGMLADRMLAIQIQTYTFVLYLVFALGITFGFLWMTTSGLTAKLDDLASTDPLTGVLNRRAFLRYIEEEFSRSERFSDSFALLMLDIDHFKQVNDQHGHIGGDEVLCAAAQNIQDAIRGIDRIGRWGGEEFAILVPRANAAAADIVAQRIHANIQRAAPLGDRSKHIPITASLGLAIRQPQDSIPEILRRADAALYRAKAAGRNCVVGELPARPPSPAAQPVPQQSPIPRPQNRTTPDEATEDSCLEGEAFAPAVNPR